MNRAVRQLIFVATGLIAWLAFAPDAAACSACFGKSNDAMFFSYYVGAFTLIGFVGAVFAGIIAFAVHMNRRARAAAGVATPMDATPTPP